MKKITKKLALATQTVRVLSGAELDGVAGGGAQPTSTVQNHSHHINAPAACHRLTGGVYTAPCRFPG